MLCVTGINIGMCLERLLSVVSLCLCCMFAFWTELLFDARWILAWTDNKVVLYHIWVVKVQYMDFGCLNWSRHIAIKLRSFLMMALLMNSNPNVREMSFDYREISLHQSQGWKPLLNVNDLRAHRQHYMKKHHATATNTWVQKYFGKPLTLNWRSYLDK